MVAFVVATVVAPIAIKLCITRSGLRQLNIHDVAMNSDNEGAERISEEDGRSFRCVVLVPCLPALPLTERPDQTSPYSSPIW